MTDRNLLGVLYGRVFEWEMRNRYADVAEHIAFVFNAMNFSAAIATLRSPRVPTASNTLLASGTGSVLACRCVMYTRTPDTVSRWRWARTVRVVVSRLRARAEALR